MLNAYPLHKLCIGTYIIRCIWKSLKGERGLYYSPKHTSHYRINWPWLYLLSKNYCFMTPSSFLPPLGRVPVYLLVCTIPVGSHDPCT